MNNKEICNFLKEISKEKHILGIDVNYRRFNKPTVHVTFDYFIENFREYQKEDFIDAYMILFQEQEGVVWFCLIDEGEEGCLLTEQS